MKWSTRTLLGLLCCFFATAYAVDETPRILQGYLERTKQERPTTSKRSVSAPSTKRDAEVLLDMYSRYPRFPSTSINKAKDMPKIMRDIDAPTETTKKTQAVTSENGEIIQPQKVINFSRPYQRNRKVVTNDVLTIDSVTEYIIREYGSPS